VSVYGQTFFFECYWHPEVTARELFLTVVLYKAVLDWEAHVTSSPWFTPLKVLHFLQYQISGAFDIEVAAYVFCYYHILSYSLDSIFYQYMVVFLFNTVIYAFVLLCLCILIVCLRIFVVPAGTLRLPWLRFSHAFSSVVRQMPGYNSQTWGMAHTLPN
jgi:hypothetical protein